MSARDRIDELNRYGEHVRIEAKRAREVGKAVLESICSFSNEPGLGGGTLLLGVVPQEGTLWPLYEACGVSDPDKVQSDLATRCAQEFNIPIRPRMSVEQVDGVRVVVVEVDEVDDSEKPVYFKARGLPQGALRRIGATDQKCTEEDLIVFYQGHGFRTSDEAALPDATIEDIDEEAVAEYRRLRESTNPEAEELNWENTDLLQALTAIRREGDDWRPTVAGILLFGTSIALRRFFPMMRIDYIRVPGREWVADPAESYQVLEIRAPLLTAVRRAHAAVRDDLPKAFHLPEGEIQREELPVLPDRVLREAIVNAAIHRTYRVHGSVQIIRYANRLEIRNPGHSLVPDDRLGQPGSQTRNPRIAAVFHETGLAETKGSGIRVMRELMNSSHLSAPTFESSRGPDQFVATFLFHHFLDAHDLRWLEQFAAWSLSDEDSRALVFAREIGAINNAAYRDLNHVDTLTASARLRKLRDNGVLEMRGRGAATYYELAEQFRAQVPLEAQEFSADTQEVRSDAQELGADAQELDPNAQELDPNAQELAGDSADLESRLPDDLAAAVSALSPRARQDRVWSLLEKLCAWRPLSAVELGRILQRDAPHLVRKHLTPMVEAGRLDYTHPEVIKHPLQRYRTPDPKPPES